MQQPTVRGCSASAINKHRIHNHQLTKRLSQAFPWRSLGLTEYVMVQHHRHDQHPEKNGRAVCRCEEPEHLWALLPVENSVSHAPPARAQGDPYPKPVSASAIATGS